MLDQVIVNPVRAQHSQLDLKISNKTGLNLIFNRAEIFDGSDEVKIEWDSVIQPGSSTRVSLKPRAASDSTAITGWVSYLLGETPIYLTFSNTPSSAVPVGLCMKEKFSDQDASAGPSGIKRFNLNEDRWLVAALRSSSGNKDVRSWDLTVRDVSTIIPANIEMRNVEVVFSSFPDVSYRSYYTSESPCGASSSVWSHFKGIAFLDVGDPVFNKVVFTHTNLGLPNGNGKHSIADPIPNGPDEGNVRAIFEFGEKQYHHPCPVQACGTFMVTATQPDADNGPSEIQVYDIRNAQVDQPITLLTKIPRTQKSNGVAMTRRKGQNGSYVIAVSQGETLTVYESVDSQDENDANAIFPTNFTTILDNVPLPESGPGLALVTQTDGPLYLFAMNDAPVEQLSLYRLDIDANPPSFTRIGALKPLTLQGRNEANDWFLLWGDSYPNPLYYPVFLGVKTQTNPDSSFRWGKGLRITSPDTIEVYASDRNVWPASSLWFRHYKKDFGIAKWSSNPSVLPDLSKWKGCYLTTTTSDGTNFSPVIIDNDTITIGETQLGGFTYDPSSATISWPAQNIETVDGAFDSVSGSFVFAAGNVLSISGNIAVDLNQSESFTGQQTMLPLWAGNYTTLTTDWNNFFSFAVLTDGTVAIGSTILEGTTFDNGSNTLSWPWQQIVVNGTVLDNCQGNISFSETANGSTFSGAIFPDSNSGPLGITGAETYPFPLAQWTGTYTTTAGDYGPFFNPFTITEDGNVIVGSTELTGVDYDPRSSSLYWPRQTITVGPSTLGSCCAQVTLTRTNGVKGFSGVVYPDPQSGPLPFNGTDQIPPDEVD